MYQIQNLVNSQGGPKVVSRYFSG